MGDKFWKIYKKYGSYIILTAVFLFFALTQKAFLRPTNLINVLQQVAIYGIIATGVTFVMISGGTDLSVGGQVACNGLLMAAMMVYWHFPVPVAIIIGIFVGIALFLAAVGLGAGDGFIDAIVGGGYRWIGYGALITVIPLLLVGIFARARLKMNYYTLMGLMAGSMTDPPALAYANGTAGNDMPALSYSTVYPVVMFLRVLTAQIFILFAL